MIKNKKLSYENTSINDLIIFGIYNVFKNGKNCVFERLVEECFTLFPEAFRLNCRLEWPDSRKLDRPLRQLRKEKLIAGDPKTSFALTKAGKEKAVIIEKKLRQEKLNLF